MLPVRRRIRVSSPPQGLHLKLLPESFCSATPNALLRYVARPALCPFRRHFGALPGCARHSPALRPGAITPNELIAQKRFHNSTHRVIPAFRHVFPPALPRAPLCPRCALATHIRCFVSFFHISFSSRNNFPVDNLSVLPFIAKLPLTKLDIILCRDAAGIGRLPLPCFAFDLSAAVQ